MLLRSHRNPVRPFAHFDRLVGGASAVVVIAATLLLGAGPALAEDSLPDRIRALERDITEHKGERYAYGLTAEIREAIELYREADRTVGADRLEARLVKDVGALTRYRDDQVKIAAVDALGAMAHEDGARYLKPLLKPARSNKADPLLLAAIESAATARDDALVGPLLKVVRLSRSPRAAAYAVETLGHYGDHERKRLRILLDLIEIARRERVDAARPPDDVGVSVTPGEGLSLARASARWAAIREVLPGALNRLTGRRIGSAEIWIQVVRNTPDPKSLFAAPRR